MQEKTIKACIINEVYNRLGSSVRFVLQTTSTWYQKNFLSIFSLLNQPSTREKTPKYVVLEKLIGCCISSCHDLNVDFSFGFQCSRYSQRQTEIRNYITNLESDSSLDKQQKKKFIKSKLMQRRNSSKLIFISVQNHNEHYNFTCIWW